MKEGGSEGVERRGPRGALGNVLRNNIMTRQQRRNKARLSTNQKERESEREREREREREIKTETETETE